MRALAAAAILSVLAVGSAPGQSLKRPGSSATNPPNHAVISGTGVARTGSGPGTVGGPPKNSGTGINGSAIRPKH